MKRIVRGVSLILCLAYLLQSLTFAVGDNPSSLTQTEVNAAIQEDNVFNLCTLMEHNDLIHQGVAYIWSPDGSCTATGTATATSFCDLFSSETSLPLGVTAGGVYGLENPSSDVHLIVYDYSDGADPTILANVTNNFPKAVVIPKTCTGLIVRLLVNTGTTVEETVRPVFSSDCRSWNNVPLNRGSAASNGITDANAITEDSVFYVSKTNGPISVAHIPYVPCWLETINTRDTIALQIIYPQFANDHVMTRVKFRGVWGEWTDRSVSLQEIGTTIDAKIADANQTGTVSGVGNPLVLENTGKGVFKSLMHTGDDNTVLNIFGKNLFTFAKTTTKTQNGVTFSFDPDAGSIRVQSSGATANTISATVPCSINGVNSTEDFKFKAARECYITISYNSTRKITHIGNDGRCVMQVLKPLSDSNFRMYVRDTNTTIHLLKGEEVGVRFFVQKDWYGDITFFPQVEVGTHATAFEVTRKSTITANELSTAMSNDGVTTITSDDNVAISATAITRTVTEAANSANAKLSNISQLFADRYNEAFTRYKRTTKPIITFIDDDTSSVDLVRRYYNDMTAVNAVGNYAVITDTMNKHTGEKELLLSYESEGFGCLYHCSAQGGNTATSPGGCYLPEYRDLKAAESNFVKGLRAMGEAGFTAYKYWVIPYAADDDDIIAIARRHGMECAITMGQYGHISPTNCDRWLIPRFSLSPKEYASRGLDAFKASVDACVEDYGWLIVVTHVNEWDKTDTMDTALKDAVTYARNAGMEVRNFPDAYEIFKPFFYMNELL